MGLGGSTDGPPLPASPIRPLYRDDEDGTHAARLTRFRTVEIPAAARIDLLGRLERAARVIGAGWAALLIEADQVTEVLTTAKVPASLHRLLAEMRYVAGTMSAPPPYVVQRAASQGFVLVMRPVRTTGRGDFTVRCRK